MNPMNLMQMVRNGQNPQQIMLSILEQQAQTNPFDANLLKLAKDNNTAGIEQIARNIAESKGLDYDKEFTSFKNMLGL